MGCRQSEVFFRNDNGPLPICNLNILLKVGFSPVPHVLKVFLPKVSDGIDIFVESGGVLLQVQSLFGVSLEIRRSGAKEDGLFKLIVVLLDASSYLLQGNSPFLHHLHALLPLNSGG